MGPWLVEGLVPFSWFLGNCGLYLVFQEFLFCSSSFHTPVNNLQTKMQCTVDMDYILDLLHFRLFVNMIN